jgi:hypothetical protein
MDSFHKLSITSSGRPQLYENEVTFLMEQSARIKIANNNKEVTYFHSSNVNNIPEMFDAGTIVITSHGIVYDDIINKKAAYRLPYQKIVSIETISRGIFSKTYKTIIKLKAMSWNCEACTFLNDSKVIKCQMCATERIHDGSICYDSIEIQVTLKEGDTRGITSAIEEAMKKKIYETDLKNHNNDNDSNSGLPTRAKEKKPAFSTRNAGVAGIIRMQDLKQRETKQKTNEAFSDLDALMSLAEDMVHLTERYSNDLKQRSVKKGRVDDDGDDTGASAKNNVDDDTKHFVSILNTMGISNPVTKQAAGSLFEEQLSRQIFEFIEAPLRNTPGNMLQLTDVYCIYNRARGTTLISPDELYHACQLFKQLHLPACLRALESGVLVLQLKKDGVSDEKMDYEIGLKILEMMKETAGNGYGGSITTMVYSSKLNLPLVLALGQLENAEKLGMICRDEIMEQITFYPVQIFDAFKIDAHFKK